MSSNPTMPWEATLTGSHGNIILSNEYEWDDAQFRLTEVRGWYGGVGIDGDQPQRPTTHGLFERAGRRTGRIITLLGSFIFEDEVDRHNAARFLSGLMGDGEQGLLTVRTGVRTLTSHVRLDGQIIPTFHGEKVLKVSVPLIAADFRLYGPERVIQVFPAGFGEGLVYPLFTTSGTKDGAELLNFSGLASSKTADTYQGEPVYARTAGYTFPKITVEPGKSYRVSVAHKADKTGSGIALLASLSGADKTTVSHYFGQPSTAIVYENGTEWEVSTAEITMNAGYDGLQLAIFANHSNMSVQDATHYFTFSVKESTPTLDWGNTAPASAPITNSGNTTAYPRVVVHGDWPAGFKITESGRTITFPVPVTTSAPVEIDMAKGSVKVSGTNRTYQCIERDWIDIPQRDAIQPRITPLATSTGWADFHVSDTYI